MAKNNDYKRVLKAALKREEKFQDSSRHKREKKLAQIHKYRERIGELLNEINALEIKEGASYDTWFELDKKLKRIR